MNTNHTAITRHAKAAKWFQCSDSPRKKSVVNRVNTTSVTTS